MLTAIKIQDSFRNSSEGMKLGWNCFTGYRNSGGKLSDAFFSCLCCRLFACIRAICYQRCRFIGRLRVFDPFPEIIHITSCVCAVLIIQTEFCRILVPGTNSSFQKSHLCGLRSLIYTVYHVERRSDNTIGNKDAL